MKSLTIAAVCLSLGGCITIDSTDYGKLAAVTGDLINAPKADAAVKKYADKFAAYCSQIQLGITVLTVLVPEKQKRVQEAVAIGSTAVNNLCAAPPSDLKSALVILADTAATIQQARKQEGV